MNCSLLTGRPDGNTKLCSVSSTSTFVGTPGTIDFGIEWTRVKFVPPVKIMSGASIAEPKK